MNNTYSYLQGGKIGDFIHSISICKYNYETTGKKADIYISNIGDEWETGLEFSYRELKPILEKQEWLNTFEIFENFREKIFDKIDYKLYTFRNKSNLFDTNWLEFYFNEFLNINIPPKEFKWIELENDHNFKDMILINRSLKPMSSNLKNLYKQILNKKENIAFICFDEKQYDNFKLDIEIPIIKVDTLYDFFIKINSCKLFIGNQSGPSAWATSMNVPRIIELFGAKVQNNYIKDVEYYKNFSYFIGDIAR